MLAKRRPAILERTHDARQRFQVIISGVRVSGDGVLVSAKSRFV